MAFYHQKWQKGYDIPEQREKVVGAVRFELTTSCTRNKRATRLRYAPPTKGGKIALCPSQLQMIFSEKFVRL
jgi:hypothetical protein